MASVSLEHLILFIASLLVASSVAGVFTNAVGRVSRAISDRGKQMSAALRADIEIISENGSGSCVYNCFGGGNLTLLVKNTGSRQLPTTEGTIEALIDGRYQPSTDIFVTVVGEATTWREGEVVRINITETLDAGDHRVKLVVDEASDSFLFRIP